MYSEENCLEKKSGSYILEGQARCVRVSIATNWTAGNNDSLYFHVKLDTPQIETCVNEVWSILVVCAPFRSVY